MIKLDFYRLIPESHTLGADDQPNVDCSYTPYKVFVLESRLYPLIFQLFEGKNLEIRLKSEYNLEKNRMDVYLVIEELVNSTDPFVENKSIILTEEQEKTIQNKIYEINSSNPDYALIDIHQLYKSVNVYVSKRDVKNSVYSIDENLEKMSFTWFQKLLEYTGLDSSFNPFIRPEGIYLTFNPNSDYKTAYYEVCKFLICRMYEFYREGAIILDDIIDSKKKENLIRDWKLKALDDEEINNRIYKPDWIDYRFARNPVTFLTRRIEGDNFIRLRISDNLVRRFGIARILQKENIPMIVEGSYLKVVAKDLETAQKISSLVYSIFTNGRVLVISASRLSEIYLYFDYASKKYGDDRSVMYSVSNNENPYIFSTLLPENEILSNEELREQFINYSLDRLIEASKVTKLKNMSPHDIIEQEYS